ncbi:MAG: efflux RND transporter periplasmic adaptor subunit [Planctomycetia bacterium]|nr:efflux RND transporter periplasmic adaptor subunit [Planctomycetia bacterium]
MSANPIDPVEEKRQQINQLIEEIARLAESTMSPPEFGQEFLQRILLALATNVGAIWLRTPQGNLQQQYQIGIADLNLDNIEGARASHDQVLRAVIEQGKPISMPPKSGPGLMEGAPAPANLTNMILLLAPIVIERQVQGILEVALEPNRNPAAIRGFLQFMTDMCSYAGNYFRNQQFRTVLGQQQVWTQLEAFTKQIHSTLNLREATFVMVNESRRLLAVDRISVASRLGGNTQIEAVSGADVVEKRSSLIQCMKQLCDAVLVWNDRLVYNGERDETLPPKVLTALDKYLAESNSKMLIVAPLRDDREDKERPCRSAMVIECFEPNLTAEALLARIDVLIKHSAPAMYNVLEHHRVPFRWALLPIANIRDSLRGKRGTWAMVIAAAAALLVAALVLIPWPLRLFAKGNLVPKDRHTITAMFEGKAEPMVRHGDRVSVGQELLRIDSKDLRAKMIELRSDYDTNSKMRARAAAALNQPGLSLEQQDQYRGMLIESESNMRKAKESLETFTKYTGGDLFSVRSPIDGVVTTFDVTDLKGKTVKPGEKLLEVAKIDGAWEVQLNIPEAHIGKIREALNQSEKRQLDVRLWISTEPNTYYQGTLNENGMGGMVSHITESEVVLKCRVEIGDDLRAKIEQLKGDGMPVEVMVQAKVNCGQRSIGYVWFYQLWEFFFEHIVF